jgi:hypothetical protein
MSLKLAILKNGDTIISDISEALVNEKVCGYVFDEPHKVISQRSILLTENADGSETSQLEITLSPWIVLSNEKKMLVSLDSVMTIVDPIESVKNLYEEKVNGKNNQVSFTES